MIEEGKKIKYMDGKKWSQKMETKY